MVLASLAALGVLNLALAGQDHHLYHYYYCPYRLEQLGRLVELQEP